MLYVHREGRRCNATNARIRKLRRTLDLTQAEFASRIGTTQNAMASYETGRRNPSSSVINNICKEFHVREDWLRTGCGEMFQEVSRDDEIAAFVEDVFRDESDSFRRRLISTLSRLDVTAWEVLEHMAEDMVRHQEAAPAADQKDQRAVWEAEADEFAAMAREQFLSEKRRESQASSAKGSGGPGGAA